MSKSVGIRLDEDLLEKIDELREKENTDRSTLVRKLLREGYEMRKKERAAEHYRKGRVTLSGAAEEAGITPWEMERFLVESGYVSEYSLKDLERELANV